MARSAPRSIPGKNPARKALVEKAAGVDVDVLGDDDVVVVGAEVGSGDGFDVVVDVDVGVELAVDDDDDEALGSVVSFSIEHRPS